MNTRNEWLAALKAQTAMIGPATALQRQSQGALIIDVREPDEWASGVIPGALLVARGQLEFKIDAIASPANALILVCAAGGRALLAAESLRRLGFFDLSVIDGGMGAYLHQGFPVQAYDRDDSMQRRYARQIALPELGERGQRRLKAASVLLVGAGGLGSPCALYLAAAGIGRLRICDADRVELSNLQRQVLHSTASIGRPKTETAAASLLALNPDIEVQTIEARAEPTNIDALVAGCDVLIDGSDNLPTRYLLNDAACKHGIPLVHAAVERFVGQIAVFHPHQARGEVPCYRCLFPQPPPSHEAPSCAEIGVLGVVPGIMGVLQASEAIKLIAGIGRPLIGRLLTVDVAAGAFRESRLHADPDCVVCRPGAEFSGYQDYQAWCAR